MMLGYDTELGKVGDHAVPVTVQICRQGQTIDDVHVFKGTDCVKQFFDWFEFIEEDAAVYVYNLDWEWLQMQQYICDIFEYTESRGKQTGKFRINQDPHSVYSIDIYNHRGYLMKFRDLSKMRAFGSLRDAGESVRQQHPEWWTGIDVKENTEVEDLHLVWWQYPEQSREYRTYLHYAKLDAYTTMRVAQSLIEEGITESTKASYGLRMALSKFGKDPFMARKRFVQYYPPLDRDMQDTVEENLLGGFVYGLPGVHKGVFVHVDYSSSYPAFYAYDRMPRGHATVYPGYVNFGPQFLYFHLVSFNFTVREGYLPVIQKAECCLDEFVSSIGGNKKMFEGRVFNKLVSANYLEAIKRHLDITDLEYIETWVTGATVGEFKDFIEEHYWQKSQTKGVIRLSHKDLMNTGPHGKSITKTRRKQVKYPGGKKQIVDTVNDPQFLSLIGFHCMQTRRAALLNDCARLIDAGITVHMCDTDSIVCGASADKVREVLPDRMAVKAASKEEIKNQLGLFEFEKGPDGSVEFDEFRCWGLKRYLELNKGQYRKSAFAGMKKHLHAIVLPDAPVQTNQNIEDGAWFSCKQLQKKQTEEGGRILGAELVEIEKWFRCEDIWYRPNVNYIAQRLMEDYRYSSIDLNDYDSELIDSDLEDAVYSDVKRNWRRYGKRSKVREWTAHAVETWKWNEEMCTRM